MARYESASGFTHVAEVHVSSLASRIEVPSSLHTFHDGELESSSLKIWQQQEEIEEVLTGTMTGLGPSVSFYSGGRRDVPKPHDVGRPSRLSPLTMRCSAEVMPRGKRKMPEWHVPGHPGR